MSLEDKIKDLIKDDIENSGYILDKVIYEKEGDLYFLRVVIDKHGIISVDDCVEVTKIINPILDLEDPISENYILDVCSKEKGSADNGQ